MDIYRCNLKSVITWGLLITVCFIGIGSTYPLYDNDDPSFGGIDNDDDRETSDFSPPVFFLDSDWTANSNDDQRVDHMLKRSGIRIPDGYQRYPRIKQRVIVPFYSYGNNPGFLRTGPGTFGTQRFSYGYNPWNIDTFRNGNRFRSGGANIY